MYIYEAKNLLLEDDNIRCNGLLVTPEKDGMEEFTPAQVGDTCVLLLPFYDDDDDTLNVYPIYNYTVTYADETVPLLNDGAKLFAFQGELPLAISDIHGQAGGNYYLRGMIVKAIRGQRDMNATIKDGENVFGIAEALSTDGTTWTKLDTPLVGTGKAIITPYVRFSTHEIIKDMPVGETTIDVSLDISANPESEYNNVTLTCDNDEWVVDSDDHKVTCKVGEGVVTASITVLGKTYTDKCVITVR